MGNPLIKIITRGLQVHNKQSANDYSDTLPTPIEVSEVSPEEAQRAKEEHKYYEKHGTPMPLKASPNRPGVGYVSGVILEEDQEPQQKAETPPLTKKTSEPTPEEREDAILQRAREEARRRRGENTQTKIPVKPSQDFDNARAQEENPIKAAMQETEIPADATPQKAVTNDATLKQ